MAAIFFLIIVSVQLVNDFHGFKINFIDSLFHSSSIAVLSQPFFGWEAAFALFSKTPI